MQPPMSFSQLDVTRFGVSWLNFPQLMGQLLEEKIVRTGQVRSRNYDVIRETIFDNISGKS